MAGNRQNQIRFYDIVAYIYLAAFVIWTIFFGISPIIFAAFVLVAALFVLPSARLGLTLIIFLTMLFERFFTLSPLIVEQTIYKIYPLDIVMILTMMAFFIGRKTGKIKTKIIFGLPERILLVFIGLVAAYFCYSLFDLNADKAVAFSTLKNYAFYPLLYFLVIFIIQDADKLKKMVHLILVGGLFIIGFILIGLARGQGLWTEFTPLSTEGVRFLAGTHAYYLILAFILALSLLIYNRFYNRIAASVIMWIWLFGILVSLMRHLWLALIVGAGLLFLLMPKKEKKRMVGSIAKNIMILAMIIIILLLVLNFWPSQNAFAGLYDLMENFKGRFVSIGQTDWDTSISWRLIFWDSAKREWLNNPLLGIGLGQKIPLEMGEWRVFEEARNLHNSILAISIQMGAIGFLIFASFILSLAAKCWKSIYRSKELAPYYLGITGGVLAILFSSLFGTYLETNMIGIFFWIMIGLLRTAPLISQKTIPYEQPNQN